MGGNSRWSLEFKIFRGIDLADMSRRTLYIAYCHSASFVGQKCIKSHDFQNGDGD